TSGALWKSKYTRPRFCLGHIEHLLCLCQPAQGPAPGARQNKKGPALRSLACLLPQRIAQRLASLPELAPYRVVPAVAAVSQGRSLHRSGCWTSLFSWQGSLPGMIARPAPAGQSPERLDLLALAQHGTDRLDSPLARDDGPLVFGAPLGLEATALQAALADGDAERQPDDVGVVELHAGAEVAVVVQRWDARLLQRLVQRLGLLQRLVGAGQRHEVHVVGRNLARPDDAVLVVVLLDYRCEQAVQPDTVAAHDDQLVGAVAVQERRADRLAVARAELEAVAQLDGAVDAERAAAAHAGRPVIRLGDVREPRYLEVTR